MLDRLIRDTDAIGRLTGDVLLLVDTAGVILHATAGAPALFGLTADQMTGLPFGLPATEQDDAEVTMTETGRRVLLRQENLQEAGLPLSRILLRDVTACRRIEAELQSAQEAAKAADKAKSHFLANITHEIRTPMIGVLGMTELTLATKLTIKQREYLEMARHSAQSLLTVLNDIVDYARIEIGALELAHVPFDLGDTVEEVISIFRPLATKKGLVLECRRALGVPGTLVGDPSRLRQILINLVGNAVKFTDKGSVILDITVPDVPPASDAEAAGQCPLAFSVTDTGIGIPRDKILAIFDSFTQADVTPARRYQGVGLGLAIVRHLVAMMGGTYQVESEEGRGSVFSFRMAFDLPEDRTEAGQAPEAAAGTGGRSLSVLLAEDNPINQIYVQELLEMDGHRVVVAHTGRRALETLRKQPFDVILMDIQMPEMDGLEATRAIRADQSGDFDPTIPIVALTAHALKGDRETFLRAGMNEYLSKPVSPEDLEAALIRATGGTSQTRKLATGSQADLTGVLDWSELLAKARGNTGFLMKLFSAFVAEQPTHMEAMRDALALADLEHLAFMAHSLKGAAATMCAPLLREACLDVERAAKEHQPDRAGEAFVVLETAMADVLVAMRGKLAAQGN
jgi:signal transduction histidine kinase/CheY-like chemotaxis protein/HPt (histidine-containing phosphotransfer) domain-containing protein